MANKRKLNAQEAKLLFESLRAIDLLPWRLGEEEARARITGIVGKEKLVECPIPQKLMLHDNTVAPPGHHPSTAGKLLLPKSIGRILRSRQYAAEIGRLYKYNIELKPADIRIALGNIIDRIISGKLRHIGSSRISLVLKKDLERVSRAMADKARIISKEARRMQAEAARVNEEMKKRSKEQIKWAVKRAKRERRRERRLPSGARRLDNIPTIHLKPITTNPPPLESNPPGKKPVRRRK